MPTNKNSQSDGVYKTVFISMMVIVTLYYSALGAGIARAYYQRSDVTIFFVLLGFGYVALLLFCRYLLRKRYIVIAFLMFLVATCEIVLVVLYANGTIDQLVAGGNYSGDTGDTSSSE